MLDPNADRDDYKFAEEILKMKRIYFMDNSFQIYTADEQIHLYINIFIYLIGHLSCSKI